MLPQTHQCRHSLTILLHLLVLTVLAIPLVLLSQIHHQLSPYNYTLFGCQVMSNSFSTPWAVAHQAPLSMGFFRQEYWSRLPFPSPGDLPNPEIIPTYALAGRFFTTEPYVIYSSIGLRYIDDYLLKKT